MTEPLWKIELLGWLRISRGGVAARSPSQKAAALLGYLALHSETAHGRERLATLLWPDAPATAGRHNLRSRLHELRRLLEPAGVAPGSVLAGDRASVQLVPGAFTSDVAEFSRAAAETVDVEGADRVRALRRALEWYRGELLSGFFDPWVVDERRRLAALHAELLARLLAALSETGRTGEAVDVAHRLIALDPLDEAAHLSLMRLYAAEGRVGAALDRYRAYAGVLRDELGEDPSPAAQALARELGAQSPPAGPRADPAPAPPRRARLPSHMTTFVGREEEIARLREVLVDARLVTISGPGGIGKTRLATELARRVQDEAGAAVLFADLSDVADERLVADAVASAAGATLGGGARALDPLVDTLAAGPRSLLVVDNAERVTGAVAAAARELLDRVAALDVLVTSRQSLGVPGEVEFRLGPLPTPGDWERTEDLAENPSVALYVDRVRAKRVDFRLTGANAAAVARLCSRLEGIPLAIELAAVRERVLPAAQLLGRLESRFEVLASRQREVPERHRTLGATIDWSYRALGDEARRAFARLSVFRGGWSLEEGEAICASPGTVEAIERLCEVSLAEAYDGASTRRFRMLETIREFAYAQVPADEVDGLHTQHALLFLALAERAQVYLSGPEQALWLERVDAEFENVRAAIDWSLRAGDAVSVVRIFVALHRYWEARSRRREARRWFREAIRLGADGIPRRLAARGLRYAGDLAFDDGDLEESKAALEQALLLTYAEEEGDTAGGILSLLGHVAARQGDLETARAHFARGAAIAAARGSVNLRASIQNDLGVLAARSRDFGHALEHFAGCLDVYRTLGDDAGCVILLNNLGYLGTILGRFESAEAYLRESLQTSERLGHRAGLAAAVTFLGLLELRRGRYREAVDGCREAVDLCLEAGERHRLVVAVEGLGLALAEEGRDDLALRALGHADALRDETGAEALLEDADLTRRCVEAVSARVGSAEAARLLAAGRAETTEQFRARCG